MGRMPHAALSNQPGILSMNVRVRGPQGQATLKLEVACSLAEFRRLLVEKTGVPPDEQEVRGGFPPKVLDFPVDGTDATVGSVGIKSGDTLVVTQRARSATTAAPVAAAAAAPAAVAGASLAGLSEGEQLARAIALSLGEGVPELPVPSGSLPGRARAASPARSHPAPSSCGGAQQGAPTSVTLPDGTAVTRRIIDSDNSCLFNAVGYVTEHSRRMAPRLRQVIADAVLADPFEWNEAVLGKQPQEYCRWIKDPSKWGGAIELSILSRHLQREIAAFDIQTLRVDIYGQDAGFRERVLLIYDGLHYDALAVAAFVGAPEELDVTVLPSSGPRTEEVMSGARQLAAKAQAARQFTDTANFTLRCGVCQVGLKGEKEAVEHAKTTGHTNFSEY